MRYLLFGVVTLLLIVESSLRHVWGFCDALLFEPSSNYEYIAQPNQHRRRFGANIRYNSHSQRSEEPDSTRRKILAVGDSVLFGGTMIDQEALATTIASEGSGYQILNISAGSWGADNCAAYITERGIFAAEAIILVCSSHDSYDSMEFDVTVGEHYSYPDRQYSTAIGELFIRYIVPTIRRIFSPTTPPNIAPKGKEFNLGFQQLASIAKAHNIPFIIYLHPEISELESGSYNSMGNEIIEWAEQNSTPIVLGLHTAISANMYRDQIHLNQEGQRHLATSLKSIISQL